MDGRIPAIVTQPGPGNLMRINDVAPPGCSNIVQVAVQIQDIMERVTAG
jgi:hypothetical protein